MTCKSAARLDDNVAGYINCSVAFKAVDGRRRRQSRQVRCQSRRTVKRAELTCKSAARLDDNVAGNTNWMQRHVASAAFKAVGGRRRRQSRQVRCQSQRTVKRAELTCESAARLDDNVAGYINWMQRHVASAAFKAVGGCRRRQSRQVRCQSRRIT